MLHVTSVSWPGSIVVVDVTEILFAVGSDSSCCKGIVSPFMVTFASWFSVVMLSPSAIIRSKPMRKDEGLVEIYSGCSMLFLFKEMGITLGLMSWAIGRLL